MQSAGLFIGTMCLANVNVHAKTADWIQTTLYIIWKACQFESFTWPSSTASCSSMLQIKGLRCGADGEGVAGDLIMQHIMS